MRNFTFVNPTRVIFGQHTIPRIGAELARASIQKVMLVYGQGSIFRNGVYEQVVSSLQENGIQYEEFCGIQPNPIISKVQQGIQLARASNAQAILAIGGGSVFDSAKILAAGFHYSGEAWDFFTGTARIEKALPVYGILTISGTGSEMNSTAVLTREDEMKKWVVVSNHLFPRLSIIDPSVQVSLSARNTAQGAADIVTHLLEVYFDGSHDVDIMREYMEGLLRTVISHSHVLVHTPDCYASRAQLAWAATLALNGSTYPGTRGGDWATHFMEHTLSAYYPVAHGTGLAILLPAWMQYTYREDPNTFQRFAQKIFDIHSGNPETDILTAIHRLQDFFQSLGLMASLSAVGVGEADLTRMAENAVQQGPLGVLKKLYFDDVLAIYRMAY